MSVYTDVFELKTVEEVEAFAAFLLEMKREAPVSLRFNVAVTATRRVSFRGDGGDPKLSDAFFAFAGQQPVREEAPLPKQVEFSDPLASTVRKRGRRQRTLMSRGIDARISEMEDELRRNR